MLHLTPGLTAYFLILAALLGMVMGSFSGCMAARLAAGEDFVRGRSHCDACGHVLSPLDLVPVVSWLCLRGRCRYCGAKIPALCPVTELLCGAAFTAVLWRYDVSLRTAEAWILIVLLLAVSLVDLSTGLIPDGLLIAMGADFALFTVLGGGAWWRALGRGVLTGLLLAGPVLLLSLVMDRVLKKESMGGGDIKLYFATGLFFPWTQGLFVLLLSCLLGILFALVFRNVRTGDPENPGAFPFGPSIAAAAVVGLIAAEPIVSAYLSLF